MFFNYQRSFSELNKKKVFTHCASAIEFITDLFDTSRNAAAAENLVVVVIKKSNFVQLKEHDKHTPNITWTNEFTFK